MLERTQDGVTLPKPNGRVTLPKEHVLELAERLEGHRDAANTLLTAIAPLRDDPDWDRAYGALKHFANAHARDGLRKLGRT